MKSKPFAHVVCLAGLLVVGSVTTAAAQDRPIDRVKLGQAPASGSTQKIIGGKPVSPGKYPFQVALILSKTPVGSEHFGQFCGGTLIDRSWVVTAAHCVPNTTPQEVDLYIGSTVLPSGRGNSGGQEGTRRHAGLIVSHQKYNPDTSDNDIALIKLTDPAPANIGVALLPTAAIDTAQAKPGTVVTVIGWGATTEGGGTTPKLMEVNVKMQDRALCEANYRAVLPTARITQNMFCAGLPEGGADSCQGDSGGFLGAAAGEKTAKGPAPFTHLGVVSWGIGCARKDLFGVYTRVANYLTWIAEVRKSS